MNTDTAPFDRRFCLRNLISASEGTRLSQALERLLGPCFSLDDEQGQALLSGSAPTADAASVPIEHEFEVLGYLRASAEPAQIQATVSLLQILIASAARDRMTAELHLHTTQENYRDLLQQHAALEESENRYRELSEQLENRVTEQVGVIEQAQRQLFQAEKMASVGQLAAGMAHEINNPIGFIQSNLVTAQGYLEHVAGIQARVHDQDWPSLLTDWTQSDLDFELDDFKTLLQESLTGVRRIAHIVADLKAFSHVSTPGETVEDVNETLRVVIRLTQAQVGERLAIDSELQPCPPLRCDAGKLNQVFLSLIQNASHAVADGGRVVVRSACQDGWIKIEVSDNGCGISKEHLSRVFDHFFTTRSVGQGTGLGLTVSRDIVIAHGGQIDIASELGQGTTVTVLLPTTRP